MIMGLLRRGKQEVTELNEKPIMGYVEIAGIGKVEVTSIPQSIPSKIIVGNRAVKIDKELYKYLWALTYATGEGQKKLSAII
jgi:hypothetical protein